MAVLFAFSLQHQVEKYGAYVGLAAFLGLAVLTVLYFAQARELKRLRDWAGRAPERAQEIEARVVAQADELRGQGPAAPEPARSGTVGPAQPAAATAAAGNGRAAGRPAPIPIGPRPAVAVAAAAARAEAAGGVATAAAPEKDDEVVVGAAAAPDAAEDDSTGSSPEATQVFTPGGDESGPADESPVADEAADESPAADEAAPGDEADAAPVQSGNGQATPAPAIPRATPRPQAQAATPLSAASATRTADVPPRRPAPVAGPRRDDDGGSRAARVTAITLASIVAVGALVFAVTQVLGGGSDKPATAPNVAASPNGSASPQASTDVSSQRPDTVVAVLNGTPTQGLAGATRDKLLKAGYSDATGLVRTGNNTDQQRQDSAVFFAPGQRRMARDVAEILGITATPEAIDPDTLALANNTGDGATGHATDVVAIVGLDQSP
jgi:LytR cell envelope-related transcriptional attenuator